MPKPTLKFFPLAAKRAERALDAYRAALGETTREHDADRVRDLLQDLLHWLASRKVGVTQGILARSKYPNPRATLNEACREACGDFKRELLEGPPALGGDTGDLAADLWWFIENITQESVDRNERFFALRERVRNSKGGK